MTYFPADEISIIGVLIGRPHGTTTASMSGFLRLIGISLELLGFILPKDIKKILPKERHTGGNQTYAEPQGHASSPAMSVTPVRCCPPGMFPGDPAHRVFIRVSHLGIFCLAHTKILASLEEKRRKRQVF